MLSNPRHNLSSACSNVHGDADVRYHGCAFECMLRRGRPLSVLVVRVRTVISPCGCAFELCGDADARCQSLWVCAATRALIFSHCRCAFECVRRPGHPLPTVAGARSNGVRRPGHRPDVLLPATSRNGKINATMSLIRMASRKAAGLEVLVWVSCFVQYYIFI